MTIWGNFVFYKRDGGSGGTVAAARSGSAAAGSRAGGGASPAASSGQASTAMGSGYEGGAKLFTALRRAESQQEGMDSSKTQAVLKDNIRVGDSFSVRRPLGSGVGSAVSVYKRVGKDSWTETIYGQHPDQRRPQKTSEFLALSTRTVAGHLTPFTTARDTIDYDFSITRAKK